MEKLTNEQVEIIKDQIEESVSCGNMYPNVARTLVDMLNEAINYTRCSLQLPTDEEIEQAANTLCPVSMGIDDGTYFEGKNVGFEMGADFVKEKIKELNKAIV